MVLDRALRCAMPIPELPEFRERARLLQEAWWVRSSSGPWSHSLPTTGRGSSSSPAVITEADAEYSSRALDTEGVDRSRLHWRSVDDALRSE